MENNKKLKKHFQQLILLLEKCIDDIDRSNNIPEKIDSEETDDLKSFQGWKKVGRSVIKGEKSKKRSTKGQALFYKDQTKPFYWIPENGRYSLR